MSNNLQISPDAPFILHALAALALVLHIGGGTAAIASGCIAILAPKGGRLHRAAGKVFFVAMLVMSGIASIVAPMLDADQWTNTTAAVFTFYLTATAWMTVRRGAGEIGRFELAAMAVPLGVAALGLFLAGGGSRMAGKEDLATVYAISVIAALAAFCDLTMIRRGGVSGPARVARHLWRMSLALLVATGSFFMGQQKFLPEEVRGTLLPALPVLGVLALLIFWMVRVRVWRPRRQIPAFS
jgi:uncharacterized membrane protein